MKKTNSTIWIASLFLLLACNSNQKKSINSVSGNIAGLEEGTPIYLDYLASDKVIPKDTAIIDADGNYIFNKTIEQVGYYRLKINEQNAINLVLNVNETPVINGDAIDFIHNYTVTGSVESERMKTFNNIYKQFKNVQDSLTKEYQSNPNDKNLLIELQKTANSAMETMRKSCINLINESPSSLVSLSATELLNPDKDLDLLKKVDDAFANAMPNSDYYKKFHEKLQKLSLLAIGELAPNITLADKNGQAISLSSLRGNIVLIDFWASWCKPCRAENPNVVLAYNNYHKKGFDVFSVSLDGVPQQQNAKENWLNAIDKDGLVWKNHVSDLKGWGSAVVPLYGIQGIPFTVLLDKEGKIIAKNIRGEALHQKLATLFQS